MFFGILFIAIGLAILLNAPGMFNATFWGLFWGIFFLVIGISIMMRNGKCPICGWGMWQGKIHGKIHEKMHEHQCDCGHEDNGHGEEGHH